MKIQFIKDDEYETDVDIKLLTKITNTFIRFYADGRSNDKFSSIEIDPEHSVIKFNMR